MTLAAVFHTIDAPAAPLLAAFDVRFDAVIDIILTPLPSAQNSLTT
jgi:hypothetical protein